MAAATNTREYRQFTAVMLIHPALQKPGDIGKYLTASVSAFTPLKNTPTGWTAVRAEYLQPRRSFYPDNIVTKESRQRGNNGFAHDIYISTKELGGKVGRVTFLASPYSLLLSRLVDAINVALPDPGLQYVDIAMPTVYRWLDADPVRSGQVNRVKMQIVGEPYADLVSLSGKRPLHSKVHDQLKAVTVPYGVGVRVTVNKIDCRVAIDRHGVIRWFQTTEDCLAHPMTLIDQIHQADAFRMVRRPPLLRENSDKVVEAEEW